MTLISNLMIPLIILFIIFYGYYKKIDIYDVFLDGAKESIDIIFKMFPCMLAMIFAINIFLNSDVLTVILSFFKPIFQVLSIPIETIPMMIMRPISGSSTLAILNNLLASFGPDSFIGRLASVIQGSTDTTLYVLTLYFGSIGIKKIRYSLWVGLAADVIGLISAVIVTNLFF